MTRSMAMMLALLLCACSDETAEPTPPELLPALDATPAAAPGPYRVGVTTMEIVTDTDRRLPVEIWYPATPAEGAPAYEYELLVGVLVIATLPSPMGAVRDAPLDLRGAPHPAVVFSHGNGGTRIQSVYLTEYLASHGFVVAAPDHVGNTVAEMVNSAAAIPAYDVARLRPGDISATLDALLARIDGWPDDPLAFSVDPARVGVAGHSFGGYTALRIAGSRVDQATRDDTCTADPGQLVCDGFPGEAPIPESQHDDRFIAALPQTPGGAAIVGDGFSAITVPTMIQAGTADQITPLDTESAPVYDAVAGPAYLMSMEDAGHFTFSDMCRLLDGLDLQIEAFDDGCGPTNVSFDVAHPAITRFATAFLKTHVAGDDSDAADLAAATHANGITLSAR